MSPIERDLSELVSERFDGDAGILDEYRRPLGVRGALAKLARGWLIERARTKRLRAELDRARAAGRRLGAYWKTQADGGEALFDWMCAHWRSRLNQALGVRCGNLSEQCAEVLNLRKELAAYREFASHWEFCGVNSDETGCDCGLTELRERFGGSK